MAKVAVQKHAGETQPALALFDDLRKQFEEIQTRAFDLFRQRGSGDGMDLDDWFRAERERFDIPSGELTEDEKAVHVRAAVPGLKAGDLEVDATPFELVVRGETTRRRESKKGEPRFTELSEHRILRRFALPAEINVEEAEARVEDGMLTVDLPKAEPVKRVRVKDAA